MTDSLDANTLLMLTTAIYFNGTWKQSFDEEGTFDGCFKIPDTPNTNCQKVPLMYAKNNYSYAVNSELDSQIVQIPYQVSASAIFY